MSYIDTTAYQLAAAMSASRTASRRARMVLHLAIKPRTVADLAFYLDVSKATIERDLAEMPGSVPLAAEPDKNHKQRLVWRLEPK